MFVGKKNLHGFCWESMDLLVGNPGMEVEFSTIARRIASPLGVSCLCNKKNGRHIRTRCFQEVHGVTRLQFVCISSMSMMLTLNNLDHPTMMLEL